MRFVPVKSIEQQSVIMLHRSRDLLVRQRTMLVNALRGHLAEVGIATALLLPKVQELIAIVKDDTNERIEPLMRQCMEVIVDQLQDLQGRIGMLDQAIHAWHRQSEISRDDPRRRSDHRKRPGGDRDQSRRHFRLGDNSRHGSA